MKKLLPARRSFSIGVLTPIFLLMLFSGKNFAQGTWSTVTTPAPDTAAGVMILLSDGTVICKTQAGGSDGIGNKWDKLTPDATGSYANGTWSSIAPMADTRLYFSSQLLQDGRLYVAGGEYGSGGYNGEVYNPQTDTWVPVPGATSANDIADANSEILPDGNVLQALVQSASGYIGNEMYNTQSNTWSPAPDCFASHDESQWVKLPDQSILFVDFQATTSERYIPSTGQWVQDANVPVQLYDSFMGEAGSGYLLPDGRAFFLGATNQTAYYTPSGNASPGTWAAGPNIPNNLGATDAAAAMMPNGNILCAFSPQDDSAGNFYAPTYYFDFNYLTNTFTPIPAPDGTDSLNQPCYYTNMLVLPDGNILHSNQGSNQYYIYSPNGNPLASGKPTIANVVQTNCHTYRITGTLFNGITEGAAYGDDWQCATNYPIIRLTNGGNVYYARSYNWNRTDVMTGALPDTAYFFIPMSVPDATYSLEVVANGNPSNPASLTLSPCTGIQSFADDNSVSVFPNPAQQTATLSFSEILGNVNISVYNELGQLVYSENDNLNLANSTVQLDVSKWATGNYAVEILSDKGKVVKRVVVN